MILIKSLQRIFIGFSPWAPVWKIRTQFLSYMLWWAVYGAAPQKRLETASQCSCTCFVRCRLSWTLKLACHATPPDTTKSAAPKFGAIRHPCHKLCLPACLPACTIWILKLSNLKHASTQGLQAYFHHYKDHELMLRLRFPGIFYALPESATNCTP